MDDRDYQRFKRQMQTALSLHPSVTLLAFSLMPNHFHLLLRQTVPGAMSEFMRRLCTGYVMYFNKKYHRVGPLFQGKYKALRVLDNAHLMEVSRYIHLNPERAGLGWRQHQHSSVWAYTNTRQTTVPQMVDTEPILELFDVPSDYLRYLSEVRP